MESLHDAEPNLVSAGSSSEGNSPVAFDTAAKERHQRSFQRGIVWLGVGMFLMAVSFGINFFLFKTDKSFISAMYILTSIGTVCIMKGLVDILGF